MERPSGFKVKLEVEIFLDYDDILRIKHLVRQDELGLLTDEQSTELSNYEDALDNHTRGAASWVDQVYMFEIPVQDE